MKHLLAATLLSVAILAGCAKTADKEIIDLPRATPDEAIETAIDSFIVATQNVPTAPDTILCTV